MPPYGILWASNGWLDVCGFSAAEILGVDLQCIQGPGTDRRAISELMAHVRAKKPCTVKALVNYDKRKRPFRHTLTVVPVPSQTNPAELEMFRAESTEISLSCGGVFAPAPRRVLVQLVDVPLDLAALLPRCRS